MNTEKLYDLTGLVQVIDTTDVKTVFTYTFEGKVKYTVVSDVDSYDLYRGFEHEENYLSQHETLEKAESSIHLDYMVENIDSDDDYDREPDDDEIEDFDLPFDDDSEMSDIF